VLAPALTVQSPLDGTVVDADPQPRGAPVGTVESFTDPSDPRVEFAGLCGEGGDLPLEIGDVTTEIGRARPERLQGQMQTVGILGEVAVELARPPRELF
jgi:hypothetical protein